MVLEVTIPDMYYYKCFVDCELQIKTKCLVISEQIKRINLISKAFRIDPQTPVVPHESRFFETEIVK